MRRQVNGTACSYWLYTFGGGSERVAVGNCDSGAPPKSLPPTARGYSIQAAEALAVKHKRHVARGGRSALLARKTQGKRQSKATVIDAHH